MQPQGWENPKMVGKIVDTGNPDARKCSQKIEMFFCNQSLTQPMAKL